MKSCIVKCIWKHSLKWTKAGMDVVLQDDCTVNNIRIMRSYDERMVNFRTESMQVHIMVKFHGEKPNAYYKTRAGTRAKTCNNELFPIGSRR